MSKPITLTAEAYRTKYIQPGPNAKLSRLLRLRRMERKEARQK